MGLAPGESVSDHSSLCRIRGRLPLEVHRKLFVFMLGILEKAGLLHGKDQGIDAQAMEANAAMKSIVRRDTGETYQEMLERLAEESGIRTPTKAELIAFDRKRQGEKTSNKDWQSTTDEAARRAKLNDGRTHCLFEVAQLTGAGTMASASSQDQPLFNGMLALPVHLKSHSILY